MTYQMKTEKIIGRMASDVFQALKEGLLFMNCGADSSTIKIDFRVGGKYYIDFRNHTLSNYGEFIEIIPNKKIVFTWCQSFGPDQAPDTHVAIELFEDGSKTRLVLLHTGFKTKEMADNHEKGWNAGFADFGNEIQDGRLRLLRTFETSAENLYSICKNPETFFAFMGDLSKGFVDFKVGGKYQLPTAKGEIKGEFLDILPNQKIALSWLVGYAGPLLDSKVTLTINKKDDGGSTLELVHSGLHSVADKKAHRFGWETVTKKIKEKVVSFQ